LSCFFELNLLVLLELMKMNLSEIGSFRMKKVHFS